MEVSVINTSSNNLPAYETISSAGMDVRADLKEDCFWKSHMVMKYKFDQEVV